MNLLCLLQSHHPVRHVPVRVDVVFDHVDGQAEVSEAQRISFPLPQLEHHAPVVKRAPDVILQMCKNDHG